MAVDDALFHLLCVAPDIFARESRVGEGEAYALGEKPFEAALDLFGQRAPYDYGAERQRQGGLALPQGAEVGHKLQVAASVDETALVYQHAGIVIAALDGFGYLREEHRRLVGYFGEEVRQHGVCRGVDARYRHAAYGRGVAPAAHEQLPVSASEGRAAVEQFVAVGDGGQQRGAYLADVGPGIEHPAVQLLDVGIPDIELHAPGVDAPVYDGIECEGVVGAGRYLQRQFFVHLVHCVRRLSKR